MERPLVRKIAEDIKFLSKDLSSLNPIEYGKWNVERSKIISGFKKIVLDTSIKPSIIEKIITFMYFNGYEDDLSEIYNDMRDIYRMEYMKGEYQSRTDSIINLITFLDESGNPIVSDYQRMTFAFTFYNLGDFDSAGQAFISILNSPSHPNTKQQACLMIYILKLESEPEFDLMRKHVLKSINVMDPVDKESIEISGGTLSHSSIVYDRLLDFASERGFRTKYNTKKICVDRKESFVFDIFTEFIKSKLYDPREVILACDAVFGCYDSRVDQVRPDLYDILFSIASEIGVDENIRADALDCILRNSVDFPEIKDKAKVEIDTLGKKGKIGSTIYENSQNAHFEGIEEQIDNYILKVSSEYKVDSSEVDDIVKEITSRIMSNKKAAVALRSIKRLERDLALFVGRRFTPMKILCMIWKKIVSSKDSETLKSRLVEELVDMSDTCSSGHISRLVNVFAGFDFEMRIPWTEQIRAIFKILFEKKVNSLKEDERDEVVLILADKGHSDIIERLVDEIYSELYKEFVDSNYLKVGEFDSYFEEAMKGYV